MSRELYFLRSSENNIVNDMVKYADKLKGEDLSIYTNHYGLTTKDLGLYALIDNKIAGAVWLRELDDNKELPVLILAVLPEFDAQEIATYMMNQFLLEAASVYEQISVSIYKKDLVHFYEDFGFIQIDNSHRYIKNLEKKEIIRPTDGYDPRRWMD